MSAFYEQVARYYDAEVGEKTDDLQMYSQLATEYPGTILDIGCGTGRVLIHLAQEGLMVHGIDDSPQMLSRLESKLNTFPHLREHITYTEGDILTHTDDNQYSLVLLTYNALMHFHTQDIQIQLLERLHSCTSKEGLLILDLPNAGEVFATQDTDAILLDRKFIDPETGHLVMVSSVSYLDRSTQLLHVDWIYDEIDGDGAVRRLIVPHLLRYYFFAEIKLLLERTGFELVEVFGSTEGDPYEDGCERMIIHARPI